MSNVDDNDDNGNNNNSSNRYQTNDGGMPNFAGALQRLERRPAAAAQDRVKAGLVAVGNALQKINLVKLIDDMEHDQELADELEVVNRETTQEAERKAMVQEALAACRAEIEDHLTTFLFFHPTAAYEEWIQDLHPENVDRGQLLTDLKTVDMRFYVADSDHRLLWNARVTDASRRVAARRYNTAAVMASSGGVGGQQRVPFDLLNDHTEEEQQQQQPHEQMNSTGSGATTSNDIFTTTPTAAALSLEQEQPQQPTPSHEQTANNMHADNSQLLDLLS